MLASIYNYLYLIIVIVMTFCVMSSYNSLGESEINNRGGSNKAGLLFTALFFIFAIGLRPVSYYFVDMMTYHDVYQNMLGKPFSIEPGMDNFIFEHILLFFAANNINEELYFLFIAAIYFGCMAWACVKIFPRDSLLAFVVYLGAFSTFSYGTNGIKAGTAASIFLLALAYRSNKLLAVFFLWVSLGFHHSMLAPIVAYIMAYLYRKPKTYLFAWAICLLLAAAHVTFFQTFFVGFTSEHGASYLIVDNVEKNVSGFRPDFIIYSAVPVFVGYYLIRKLYVVSDTFNFLWCTYTMTNCVFLLCTYGTFINRIAYLSWLMYPIVLLYPFVNTKWNYRPNVSRRYLKYMVYGHLGFTAFMSFVYYA